MTEEKNAKTTEAAKPLTLEQKLVELRKAIPALQQKKYSDGVKYAFVKISDIFEHLTPAMNEQRVNFDIVKETPTRYDELGNAIYYHSYQQQTRNGPRTVWVYEADVTFRWTNADDPHDCQEVTLHAIGTNDGGPDKAKGSAWTYCTKYLLFEKFGVDQSEDDPDTKDLSEGQTPQRSASGQPTGARNGGGGTNTRPNGQNAQNEHTNAPRTLSDAQLARMYRIGEEAGYTKEQVNSRCAKKYGAQDPKTMTKPQYDETCSALEAAAKQGGNSNA